MKLIKLKSRAGLPNLLKPKITATAVSVSNAAANVVAGSSADLPVPTMSKEELLNRAKANIEFGELTYRERHIAAADDIAVVYDNGRGPSQREIGRSLGKSGAWVCQILKWRREGYVGLPFAAIESVQDLNNADPDSPISETAMPAVRWTEPEAISAQEIDQPFVLEGEEAVPRDEPSDTPDMPISETALAAVSRSQSDMVSSSERGLPSLMEGEEETVTRDELPDTSGDRSHQENEDYVAGISESGATSEQEQRRNLIEALEFLDSTRPMMRAKFALLVESRRAGLGLCWDQLIVSASDIHRADKEPGS